MTPSASATWAHVHPSLQRALDLGVLHAVGEAAERDDGGEAVGGALGVGELGGERRHGVGNLS